MTMTRQDRLAIAAYRAKHGNGPFLAADAVVTSADGAVLLVRRSAPPQKGRLALPGGFLQPEETLIDCALRELAEETGLVLSGPCAEPVRKPLLRDSPLRDPRARIVSAVFLFALSEKAADREVKGADDATDAGWCFPDASLKQEDFYADHHDILVELGQFSG